MLVGGRYGGNGRGRIVPRHGNHLDRAKSRQISEFGLKLTHHRAGLHYGQQHIVPYAELAEQLLVELARDLVHHTRGGSIGIFAHFAPGKQIRQQVRHKKYALGALQRRVAGAGLRVQLEDSVEIHYLNSSARVELLTRDEPEHLFGNACGIRVAVTAGLPGKSAVFAHAAKIDSPGVDTNGIKMHPLGSQLLKAGYKMPVHCIRIPIHAAVFVYDFRRKTVNLLH